MKKSLLLLAAFVLSVTNVFSQEAPRKVTLADNQLIMGGYVTDDVATVSQGLGLTSVPGTLGAAIYLPASDFSAFDGGKVVKIRVGQATAAAITRVYITPIADGNIQDDIVSLDVTANAAGWSEFTLDEDVTLDFSTFDALLLGYDYTQTSTGYPISCVSAGNAAYPLYIFGNLGQGEGWYSMGDSYGNLSIQAIVEKDFAQYEAIPQYVGNIIVPFGSQKNVYVPVLNQGKATLTSIDYTLTVDGTTVSGQSAVSPTEFASTGYATVPFTSADTEKTQSYTVTITKVNGEANTAKNASVSGLVASTSKKYQKRVAVEEFTGTGCPWCPRGIVGMELLRNSYPDKVVNIAIHQYNSSDPMYISPNNYADLGFNSAPSCALNRSGIVDPYYGINNNDFGISELVEQLSAEEAFADIEVSGQWNEDFTKVVATASIDGIIEGSTYDVEFVLVGDSITGTSTSWRQSNNYASYTAAQVGSDLALFAKNGQYGQTYVTGFKFNDVALSSSYASGTNRVSPVTIGSQPASSQFELSLPTSATLLNAIRKDQMYVAALLVDPVTGVVVNSAKSKVPYDASGILLPTADSREAARYTLDGRQLPSARKGLNIVRMSDGSVRKVVVK